MRWHLHWLSRTKRPHCAGSYHIHCKFFLELGADKWRRPPVFHAVSDTCIHRWRLLSVEEQTNKAHGSYMQWQQPACNASFYYICRGDRRRSHGSCMWRQQHAFTATEVEFADIPAAGVAHSVTVTYGSLCMFLWLYWYATIVEKVTTITCNTFNRYGSVAPWSAEVEFAE